MMKEENMGEFNFKSSVCTSRKQSERLLALGLKKETADMCLQSTLNDVWSPYIPIAMPYSKVEAFDLSTDVFRVIPAWSLHRLIEMMPNKIRVYDDSASLIVSNTKAQYYFHDVEYSDYLSSAGKWEDGNVYHNIISCIEWLIKEGYFNKEYLV